MAKQLTADKRRFIRPYTSMATVMAMSILAPGCSDVQVPTDAVAPPTIESPQTLSEFVASDPVLGQYIVTFADSVSARPAKSAGSSLGDATMVRGKPDTLVSVLWVSESATPVAMIP